MQFTPIYANDPRTGKIYRVKAGGLLTMNSSAATITLTPRIGTTTAGGITLGASGAQATNSAFVSKPWFFDFIVVCQSVGAPGANSGFQGEGLFVTSMTTVAAGSMAFTLGGTLGTADISIQSGFALGVALSTGTMTTHFAFIQSFN